MHMGIQGQLANMAGLANMAAIGSLPARPLYEPKIGDRVLVDISGDLIEAEILATAGTCVRVKYRGWLLEKTAWLKTYRIEGIIL